MMTKMVLTSDSIKAIDLGWYGTKEVKSQEILFCSALAEASEDFGSIFVLSLVLVEPYIGS